MKTGQSLALISQGRDNNFNLIRFICASLVVYAHAFGITGHMAEEPFYKLSGFGTGDVGVDVFFLISGFLVTKSLSGKDLFSFFWARITRIFPALWLSTLLSVVVVGVFLSPLSAKEFWRRPETISYLAKNWTMLPGFGSQQTLPFAFRAGQETFNTSLWTLPHELQMYVLLAVIGYVGGLRYRYTLFLISVIGFTAFVGDLTRSFHVFELDRARFIYLFFSGSTFYAFRDKILLDGKLAVVACLICISSFLFGPGSPGTRAIFLLAIPYLVFWISYIPGGAIRQFNMCGDYSYGLYIFAGPIQVYLSGLTAGSSPLWNFLFSMLLTIPLALASWHLIERRALRLPIPTFLAGSGVGSPPSKRSRQSSL